MFATDTHENRGHSTLQRMNPTPPELYATATSLYAGVVYDALRFDLNVTSPFVLAEGIKPAWGFKQVLFGPAFTCKSQVVADPAHLDDTIRIKMFKSFYPGCVQVIASGGYRKVAQFGDISAKLAHKFGCVGAVLDGPTRDIKIISEDGFKIFSQGVQPTDAYGRWQIVDFEVPITMPGIDGDVEIQPGDYIWGDTDGAIRIPKDQVDECIGLAAKRMERENAIRTAIKNYSDIQKMYDELGRW